MHTQQTGMIRKLLAVGASLNLMDHKGNTPLHVASKLHGTKCLDEMLRSAPLRHIREISEVHNNEGLSCVHVAAKHGNMDVLRKLNNIGVDLNMQVCNLGFCQMLHEPGSSSYAKGCLLQKPNR